MAKTNKQQKEIDELIIERNNLIDTVEILEKGTRQIAKILGLDGIAETTYFNDADFECIEKAIEKLQGKYEKCFEELSMKCGECEGLLKANETIVKAHNDLENKVDEQFKVITKYEKELEEQDKEIETLRQKNRELEKSVKGLDEICEKRRSDCFKQEKEKEGKDGQITFLTNEIVKLEYKLRDTEKNEELKLKARKLDLIIKLQEENEVIKQDKANLLAELTRQINEKSALRKENKRLKKRRREGRYNPKKVYEKLARGRLCYIPEGDYLPTKVHESLIDAMEEGHRLADKTGNQVYIVGTYCKI